MKALSKLSDEMNAEQFSGRLNDIYNKLLNLLGVDRSRAQSLICAALSFKKWDEGSYRCNSILEEGNHAFDDACWKRFLEWVAEKIEDVSLWKGLDEVSLGRVDDLVVSMAKYVTSCHRNKRVSPFCICLTVYAWMNVTGLRGTLRGSLRGRMRGG